MVNNLWLEKILVLLNYYSKSNMSVPVIHSIIHQEGLCCKIMKLDDVMNTIFKIIILIR